MTRKVLWAVLVVGVLMVAAPFAFAMPTRASAGEEMLGDFQPIMQPDNVQETARYYDEVFVPLGEVAPALSAENLARLEQYMPYLAQAPAEMQRDFGALFGLMKANVAIFEQVPAGLAHYEPLVDTMQGNVTTYRDVSRLPSFELFTWLFVVPGVALVALSLVGLFWHRRPVLVPAARSHAAHA
jgi:hypothetical protein